VKIFGMSGAAALNRVAHLSWKCEKEEHSGALVGFLAQPPNAPFFMVCNFRLKKKDEVLSIVETEIESHQDFDTCKGYSVSLGEFCEHLKEAGALPGWWIEPGDVVEIDLYNVTAMMQYYSVSLRIEQRCTDHEDCRRHPAIGRECLRKRVSEA
jgi:hypothetical protein